MTEKYRWGMTRADRDDWRKFWSEVWRERRAMGIEQRTDVVAESLKQPVDLPEPLGSILAECGSEFTPAQFESLVYRYGYGLTLQEAADVLGIKRQTFRKRLVLAQRKVDHLTGAYAERAAALTRAAEELGIDGGLSPERMSDYVIPLVQRQGRWEQIADRLWGLTPRTAG